MNRKYLLLIPFIFSAIFIIFFLFQDKSDSGRVLGLSINNFYSEKSVEIEKIPQRKSEAKEPLVGANTAVLIDNKTKYPLYLKNGDSAVSIASITKVMTACIVIEDYNLEDKITISSESAKIHGSSMDLKEGEEILINDLLYGLLMNSGNDAAHALATHGQELDDFVQIMNDTAERIGLRNTQYFDPAGLDDRGKSTAHDVAILFSYALEKPVFREIISTGEKEVRSVDGGIAHKLKNSTRLTTQEIPMDGIIGGKTGFTFDAGHTMVAAAERNGMTLISVILNTTVNTKTASAYETKKILEWGFESFELI